MKIFCASQSFYPHIGGVSTYLLNLALELKKRGHEVVEVHLRPPFAQSEDDVKGIDIYRVPKEPLNKNLLKGYFHFKEMVYKECHNEGKYFDKDPVEMDGFEEYNEINTIVGEQIAELLEQGPAEIVNIHDFQLLFLYRFIPRGIPLIFTWHIPFSNKMSKYLKEFLIKHMKEFDKVIFSSRDYIKAAVKAGLPRKKAELIYPIANTNLFKPMKVGKEFFDAHKLPKNAKIILCVQRIDPKSGHEQLIKAMPLVLKKVPEAHLVFVGDKSMSDKISKERQKYKKKIKELIKRKKLGKHITFAGNVLYEKMPPIYNAADVVALTSTQEGFGLSITEGMACGKPVLGTRTGGIVEQIENRRNGYLVKVQDFKSTAEKLVELLKNQKLRERMGKESLKIVEKKFRLEEGVDKYIKLFNELLKEKGNRWNLRMIKLDDVEGIVTDFDRTLTDKPGIVKSGIISKLKELGKPLILATGRPWKYVKEFNKKYPVWSAIVAENGSVLFLPKKGMKITLNSSEMDRVKKLLKKVDVKMKWGEVIVSAPLSEKRKIKSLLKGFKLNYRVNVDEIMVMPKGVDKGSGTKLALQQLEIEPEKTIIFADGENDVDLFNVPGFRVAVANAAPKLKLLADHVTEKSHSSGLQEVIEELKK